METSTPVCLFTGRVEARDDEYVVTVPEREIDLGAIEPGETYRIGTYPDATASTESEGDQESPSPDHESDAEQATRGQTTHGANRSSNPATSSVNRSSPSQTRGGSDAPPVSEGESMQLRVEDVGDQGDGIARVGPGYVVFIPDTEIGQQPHVRVMTVRENFAFAEVINR